MTVFGSERLQPQIPSFTFSPRCSFFLFVSSLHLVTSFTTCRILRILSKLKRCLSGSISLDFYPHIPSSARRDRFRRKPPASYGHCANFPYSISPTTHRSLVFNTLIITVTMLLPSALPCDMRRPSTRSRFTPTRLFTTPPPSDDDLPSGNGLLGTCRALQSLLNGSPAPSPRRAKPSRLQSPVQIRSTPSTRSRKALTPSSSSKPSPRPRGVNKRRRNTYEEDLEADTSSRRFSTPKRRRQIPYDLPLGLSHSDFYSLQSPPVSQSPPSPTERKQHDLCRAQSMIDPDAALPSIEEADEMDISTSNNWSSEDDQRLVELVLDKFRLSRRELDACARRLGKDSASVGQRWQALVGEGNVGLRLSRNQPWM